MKKILLLLILVVCFMKPAYAQEGVAENFTTHKVEMGETVLLISKKYKITPGDIYEYNKDAVNGISNNSILRIPLHRQLVITGKTVNDDKDRTVVAKAQTTAPKAVVKEQPVVIQPLPIVTAQEVATTSANTTVNNEGKVVDHEVKKGETLSELADKYNTTIADITKENAAKLKHGLQAGQNLTITAKPAVIDNSIIIHDVVSGETLIGLSRTFNTTIDAITADNERILKRGLQIGQKLKIKPGTDYSRNTSALTATDAIATTATQSASTGNSIGEMASIEHKVQSGETLTGLARKYDTTIQKITEDNKSRLRNGLQAGQVLSINKSIN